ncbi:hypothetical protein [Paracoccus sp. ME4]|uniref:hypothetical protein n=1 Tax=Paracoccus sp. ME4 TaxID=3138066 RepID=UPI00398AB31C
MPDTLCLSGHITLEPLRFADPDQSSRNAWNGMHRSDVVLIATGGPWRWLIEVPPPAHVEADEDSEQEQASEAPIFIPTFEIAERHTVRIGRSVRRSLDEAKADIMADWEMKVLQLGIRPELPLQQD